MGRLSPPGVKPRQKAKAQGQKNDNPGKLSQNLFNELRYQFPQCSQIGI